MNDNDCKVLWAVFEVEELDDCRQSAEEIAARINMPVSEVADSIERLESHGMIMGVDIPDRHWLHNREWLECNDLSTELNMFDAGTDRGAALMGSVAKMNNTPTGRGQPALRVVK